MRALIGPYVGRLLAASLAAADNLLHEPLQIESTPQGKAKDGFDSFLYYVGFDLHDTSQPEIQAMLRTATQRGAYAPLVTLGMEYAHEEGFEKLGEELLTQAIDVNAGKGFANCPHRGLASMYFRTGDYRSSLQHYRIMLQDTLKRPESNTAQVRRYRWRVAFLSYALSRYEPARKHLRMLLKNTDDPNERMVLQLLHAAVELELNAG
ncbi:MAG: hypothetical protein P9M14_16275 [Candidatus Alcyoniella australis]|nr:hypothetical protein [Candidatus Alcyoniella australis]